MIIQVSLTYIDPNPWQTRPVNDDHAHELAFGPRGIKAKGLLQEPVGRLIDAETGKHVPLARVNLDSADDIGAQLPSRTLSGQNLRVQLAFGHHRCDAFRLLARDDETAANYQAMPVMLRDLDDEEMSTLAWTENYDRKQLTPLQEAQAIQKRMDDFGLTQQEVADHLGLTRSTVANKLRLLKLPADLQDSLDAGQLTERAAMALVPLHQLPEPAAKTAKRRPSWQTRPEDILRHATEGASSDVIREEVDSLIQNITYSLDPDRCRFPIDFQFDTDDIHSPKCTDCSVRVRRGQEMRCPDRECNTAKRERYRQIALEQASEATGLPILPEDEWSTESFYGDGDLARQIIDAGCEHLHLAYNVGAVKACAEPSRSMDGCPNVGIVCYRGSNARVCYCLRDLQADDEADERKKIERRQKKELREQISQPATDALANALINLDAGAWRALLYERHYQLRGKAGDWTAEEIAGRLAKSLIEDKVPYRGHADLPKSRRTITEFFNDHDLEPPWDLDIIALQRWEDKVGRVVGWVNDRVTQVPTPEQVQGNIDNLLQLSNHATDVLMEKLDEAYLTPTLDRIPPALDVLTRIKSTIQDLGDVDESTVNLLIRAWTDNTQFEHALDQASIDEIRYALCFVPDDGRERRQLLEEQLLSLAPAVADDLHRPSFASANR